MDKRIQTGLRIPETVRDRIVEKADSIGVSMNDVILMLINIGLTVMDNGFTIPHREE